MIYDSFEFDYSSKAHIFILEKSLKLAKINFIYF